MGQQPARSITDAGCVHAILAMILECTRTGSESGRCRSTCGVFRERITSQVTSGHMWSSLQTVDCGPHILPPWAVCICQINPQIPAGITRLYQLNIFIMSYLFIFQIVKGKVAVPVEDILERADSRTRSSHNRKCRQLPTNSTQYLHSFFHLPSPSGIDYLRPALTRILFPHLRPCSVLLHKL